ncbi:MAG: cell division protein [Pseudonocardiales bacterium]|nr:MAG: cell division protein [Pseudonocardiales bacterium]
MTVTGAHSSRLPRTGRVGAPKRRGVELILLVFATVVVAAADAIVEVTVNNHISSDIAAHAAAFAAVWGVAHLVVRRVAPYADPVLLPCVAVLNGLGLVLIHRLDLAAQSKARSFGNPVPSPNANLQIVWMCIGLVLFVAVLVVIRDHKALARYSYSLALAGLILLALPGVLPASFSEVNGARIWIRVGGFSIQPGEFAKLALMVFFASYLVAKRDVLSLAGRRVLGLDLPRGRDLGPVLLAWAASLLILLRENDLGSSLLFFGIFVVMLYIATERTSWLIIGSGLFVAGSFLAYSVITHVQSRVDVWLHPFRYEQTSGYQLVQALFGLGNGGLFGTGLGGGRPDMVPLAASDFIVSSAGEELGLFGLAAIIVIYGLIVMRGFRVGLSATDSFGTLLAAGLAFSLGLQVFIIVGGVTRLIPLTGLTTPYLSYGGSSLVANLALLALLLRISDAGRRPPDPARTPLSLTDAHTEVVAP